VKGAAVIALCIFGTDAVVSFLRDHAVLLAIAVSGAWLYAAYDYSRKGNSAGTFGWGAIAVLILFGFCIHELISLQGSWAYALLAAAGITGELVLSKRWLSVAKIRSEPSSERPK
jgi:hypothetical protein